MNQVREILHKKVKGRKVKVEETYDFWDGFTYTLFVDARKMLSSKNLELIIREYKDIRKSI